MMVKKYQIFLIFLLNLNYVSLRIGSTKKKDVISFKEEENNIKPPKFSKISGFYSENFKLKLTSEENTKIYYTLDSTDPRTSESSQEFKDYILIYDRSSERNIYSAMTGNENSPVSITRGQRYREPSFPVDKAMIVRAVAKNEEDEYSEVISKTYFVTTDDLYKYQDLTVISMVTNPENLFSPDKGIYVTGQMYQDWKKSDEYDPQQQIWDPNSKCNFFMKGSEWERETFLTIFDKGEISVQQNVGIRIKGKASRNYASKTFNIYARKKYGKSTMETDILKDNYDINGNLITSYKGFTFRSVYDDSRLREIIGKDLFYLRKDLTSTNMKFSVMFLNGEYWGLYLLSEKLSDDFIGKNYLISSKNISLLKDAECEEGPEEELTIFQEFCENYSKKDLSDDKLYEKVKNFIDIDSLIELFVNGIYIANRDWPGKNDGEWRYRGEKIEGNKYSDGKWRFIIFDLDYSMNSPSTDSFNHALSRMERGPLNKLFFSLLKNNSDFRHKFVNIFCDNVNEIYNPNKVVKVLEKYKDDLGEIFPNSQLRWRGWDIKSKLEGFANYKSNYLQRINSIITFYQNRPKYALQHMKDFIGLKGNLVNLTVEIKGKGKVRINSITPEINGASWVGQYFSQIPISIKAIPDVGYNFKEWSGYIESNNQNEEIILFDSQTIIVVFD